jgi:acid phosphatase
MMEMLSICRRYLTRQTSHKFVLISGHDSTLAAALALLDCPLVSVPRLASHLSMQVLEDAAHVQFVRFVHNGDPLRLPAFGDRELVELAVFSSQMMAKVSRICSDFADLPVVTDPSQTVEPQND